MKKTKIKAISLMVCLLMIVGVVVGGTVAFLMDASDEVENTFTPSEVTTDVDETFDGITKSNVKIQNTGDTDAFIRAAIVVTWQDAQGNVYGQKPVEDVDYEIDLNTADWVLGKDGFYYHKAVVAPGTGENDGTAVLITECKMKEGATSPDSNYKLCVEILGSGVQAGPAEAVEAWSKGVAVMNGKTLNVTPMPVGGGNQ